jgi:myo-inositol 2-dehydrogenase/D-chiro-inositol 1-dehydrogenase
MDRRAFLKSSVAATLGVAAGAHGAGSDIIRVGLVGCGGRGAEAAQQAMGADPGVRLAAMADKSADEVLVANAAKFHPLHTASAIASGMHVFVETPHAIGPSGIKVIRAACEQAREKNRGVLSGLQSRFWPGYRETIDRIHDGAIGAIIAVQETWLRLPYALYPRRPGLTEAEWPASNQHRFHGLSGDDMPQTLVHNLDRAGWTLIGQTPPRCYGMAGVRRSAERSMAAFSTITRRSMNTPAAYACTPIAARSRTVTKNSSILMGTRGRRNLTRGVIEGENPWRYSGPKMYSTPLMNPYQFEHVKFFKSIRAGKPINSSDYLLRATRIAIMGELSCCTGDEAAWEQATTSDFCLSPEPEDIRAVTVPPVPPDKDGIHPVFTPGQTKLAL